MSIVVVGDAAAAIDVATTIAIADDVQLRETWCVAAAAVGKRKKLELQKESLVHS